jgi:hypothetical protein
VVTNTVTPEKHKMKKKMRKIERNNPKEKKKKREMRPLRRRAFSDFFFSPPIKLPGTIQGVDLHILDKTSKICSTSSRVGANTIAGEEEKEEGL